MHTYRIKLRLNGGFITPFHADTVFGGLCWAVRYSEGNKSLEAMLADYRAGRPWFVLSNAYPGDMLPKPMIKVENPPTASISEQVLQARDAKRLKKVEFLTPDEFMALAGGSPIAIQDKEKPIKRIATMHNQTERIYGSTAEGGQLFEQLESYLDSDLNPNPEPDHAYLAIYIKLQEPSLRDWLKGHFLSLGQTGLGKRKSVGKGSFTVIDFEECDIFGYVLEPNAFLSLSNFVPATNDPVLGHYKTFVKYGKLGEEYASSEYPFKRPLLMIQAGSVFLVNSEVKPFYGKMIENIAPAYPQVLQYALAFSVPVRLEGWN